MQRIALPCALALTMWGVTTHAIDLSAPVLEGPSVLAHAESASVSSDNEPLEAA